MTCTISEHQSPLDCFKAEEPPCNYSRLTKKITVWGLTDLCGAVASVRSLLCDEPLGDGDDLSDVAEFRPCTCTPSQRTPYALRQSMGYANNDDAHSSRSPSRRQPSASGLLATAKSLYKNFKLSTLLYCEKCNGIYCWLLTSCRQVMRLLKDNQAFQQCYDCSLGLTFDQKPNSRFSGKI